MFKDRARELTHTTGEGFLKFESKATRVGIFKYRDSTGAIVNVVRKPEDVFQKESLDSAKGKAVTNDHPPVFVDVSNFKEYGKGITDSGIEVDSKFVRIAGTITDQELIDAIQNGKAEVSMGYTADLIQEDGVYDGEEYKYRQTNIRYNHLAIVDRGRAGREAKILFDSENFLVESIIDEKDKKSKKKEKDKMSKQYIADSGIGYDVPEEVIADQALLKSKVQKLENKLADSEKSNTKLKADVDIKDKEIAEQKEKILTDEQIEKRVSEKLEAKTKLIDSISGKIEIKDAFSKTEREIKEAFCDHVLGETDFKDKDDVYVDAFFDAALKKADETKEGSNFTDGLDGSSNIGGMDFSDSEKARKDMIKSYKGDE
jgi:hypothetical protein